MDKILTILIYFLLMSCSAQQKKCSKFKTGTFKYEDPASKNITITRNDTLQIENNLRDKVKITTSVKWLSKCKYVLTYIDVTNYPYRDEIIGKKIFVSIINTEGNRYTARVKSATMSKIINIIN